MYITRPDEVVLRYAHPELFQQLSQKLVILAPTFQTDYLTISPNFMWMRGHRSFTNLVTVTGSGSHLFWMFNSPFRCPTNMTHILWTKNLHCNIGGVTEARGKGSGGHWTNRQALCPTDSLQSRPLDVHSVQSDLLSLLFPRCPVLYPTHILRTGWGMPPYLMMNWHYVLNCPLSYLG
jgi:hypothetical protein